MRTRSYQEGGLSRDAIVLADTGTNVNPATVPYLGQVATRAGIPNQIFPGPTQPTEVSLMTESFHIARDDLDELQIVVPNFYVRIYEGNFVESPLGADSEWMVSVRNLRTGEFTQLTFGGQAIGTITDNTFGFTDMVTLKSRINRGEKFAVRMWVHNMVGCPYYMTDNCASGDGLEFSGGRTFEKTMSGDVAIMNPLACLRPAAILGMTTRSSVYIIGDSRAAGYQDTMDSSLDVGEIARSIGPYYGYINPALPGESLQHYKTNCALRLQLAQFCSHVVGNLAGNDIMNMRPTADIIADLQTVWANPWLAGKDVSWLTISPFTTSTNAVPPEDAVRVAVNNFIRATPPGLNRFFEIGEIDESYRDSGLNVDPYYADHIHNNRYGYLRKQSSQRIRPELFTR